MFSERWNARVARAMQMSARTTNRGNRTRETTEKDSQRVTDDGNALCTNKIYLGSGRRVARVLTLRERVEVHEKVVAEHERNIEVIKEQIHQERLKIEALQKECKKHDFKYSPGAGEHESECANCGRTF
jgi:hypothetical protein